MICNGVPVKALYEDGHRPGQSQVREVTQPPLCAVCMVEAELDELSEEAIVQKGLRRVDKLDGGVTKRRWQVKEGQHNVRNRPERAFDRDRSRESPRHTGFDGSWSDGASCFGKLNFQGIPHDPEIWVNLFDPINGPSFKPSPLKPVPLFMQRPQPKPVFEGLNQQPNAVSYSQSRTLTNNTRPHPFIHVRSPSPRVSGQRVVRPPRRQSSASSEASSIYHREISPLDWKSSISYIKEEPLKRPSSRLVYRGQLSETLSSAYETPPEYADEPTPLPCLRPLTSTSPAAPLSVQIASKLHDEIKTAPPQSSEYLDRYRPLAALDPEQQAWHGVKVVRDTGAAGSTDIEQDVETALLEGRDEDGNKAFDFREGGRIRGVGAELRRFFMGR